MSVRALPTYCYLSPTFVPLPTPIRERNDVCTHTRAHTHTRGHHGARATLLAHTIASEGRSAQPGRVRIARCPLRNRSANSSSCSTVAAHHAVRHAKKESSGRAAAASHERTSIAVPTLAADHSSVSELAAMPQLVPWYSSFWAAHAGGVSSLHKGPLPIASAEKAGVPRALPLDGSPGHCE
jgi:hypothetical protein